MFTIEFWQSNKNEWNWHAVARNGKVLFFSTQAYSRRATMLRLLRKWFPMAKRIETVRCA